MAAKADSSRSRSHKLQADFFVRCTLSSASREQSGNNLLGSCSHQQTVYCKKVVGSKAKHQPEPKAYEQKSIPSLLRKPRTSQKREGEKFMFSSERARVEQNFQSSIRWAVLHVITNTYLLLFSEQELKYDIQNIQESALLIAFPKKSCNDLYLVASFLHLFYKRTDMLIYNAWIIKPILNKPHQ